MDDFGLISFVGFFLAGLAVNLTPCVYPMLTVTAALFKPKEGETVKNSFTKALVYVLGIAITYSTLGYFAASTGKIFGAALQSSWVLGGVALMMFVLGLSMLGLFQLSLPSELLSRLSGLRKANYAGLFASGMLVGVFAAPCIGPPVLALLAAVANNGDPRYGFLAFFVFSLGLGFPYLLLGTFSSLVTKLPKAGGWLIWIERIFGLILLGFAAFYLSLALHVQSPAVSKNAFWKPYSEQSFTVIHQAHTPVIIDFYADWCIGCHELDQEVFSKAEIKSKLSQVTVLRLDATKIDDPSVSAVIDRYGIIGLPTVLFLDANGNEVKQARVEGSVSIREFRKSLDLWAKQVGVEFKQ